MPGDFRNRPLLPGTEFDNGNTPGREQPRQIGDDCTVAFEAVRTAVECGCRIVRTHLDLQSCNVTARDIGRVGNDDIEPSPEPVRPVAA